MAENHELLLEGQILEGTQDRGRQEVTLDLIREGFGNKRDGHYYGAGLLEGAAEPFKGKKMYVDHLDEEAKKKLGGLPRKVFDMGGRILEAWPDRNDEDKTVIRATAKIANPLLWQLIEADPEALGVSINARGHSRMDMVEGRRAKIVESISEVASVDFVTEAGAGGKILELAEAMIAESDEEDGMATGSAETEENPVDAPEVEDADDEVVVGENDENETDETDETDEPVGNDEDEGGETKQQEARGRRGRRGGRRGRRMDLTNPKKRGRRAPKVRGAGASAGSLHAKTKSGPKHAARLVKRKSLSAREAADEINLEEVLEGLVLLLEEFEPEGLLEAANGQAELDLEEADDDLLEAWEVFAELCEADPEMGEEMILDLLADDDEDDVEESDKDEESDDGEDLSEEELEQMVEAMAHELATDRLREAVTAAVEYAREQFDEELEEAEAKFEQRLAQRDQRDEAARIIESARDLKTSTQKALKEDFFDAYFEAETDDAGEVVKSSEDLLTESVKEAIDERRREVSEYREARVLGAGDSNGSAELAGERPAARRQGEKAPADAQVDKELNL
jgi:hypothetical protein